MVLFQFLARFFIRQLPIPKIAGREEGFCVTSGAIFKVFFLNYNILNVRDIVLRDIPSSSACSVWVRL